MIYVTTKDFNKDEEKQRKNWAALTYAYGGMEKRGGKAINKDSIWDTLVIVPDPIDKVVGNATCMRISRRKIQLTPSITLDRSSFSINVGCNLDLIECIRLHMQGKWCHECYIGIKAQIVVEKCGRRGEV